MTWTNQVMTRGIKVYIWRPAAGGLQLKGGGLGLGFKVYDLMV